MKPFRMILLAIGYFSVGTLCGASGDWPGWRGPTADGHAESGQRVPVRWTEGENIIWKAALPGRGHASPTVVGDRIFIPTAEEDTEVQAVIVLIENPADRYGARMSIEAD